MTDYEPINYGLHSYLKSQELDRTLSEMDTPFYAQVMCLMRKADTKNLAMLKACWPGVWDELQLRHWAPGGIIPGDPDWDKLTDLEQEHRLERIERG